MGRILLILFLALGISGAIPVDAEGDQTEMVEVDVALPATVEPLVVRPTVERWVDQRRDTGREPSASIFRPPV